MFAVFGLLIILGISVLITRIATVALTQTGLSREMARFQARSAFTGVGFTTAEAESVVRHPVRRRIVMLLMLLGNVGIVTVLGTLILGFVGERPVPWFVRLAFLVGGIALLWWFASSKIVDRWLSRIIYRALDRWTDIEVRDYANLLRLSGDYSVTEVEVEPHDWLADATLRRLGLREEGVLVLGITRENGTYLGAPNADTWIRPGDVLILYGTEDNLLELDERRRDLGGEESHRRRVQQYQERIQRERHADPLESGEKAS